ncbi:MAG: hypothetical protein LBP88_08555 [Treponema sp.]|nr:hypothetical protein [Treponema sp.]
MIHAYEAAAELAENLTAYAEAVYTTDTRDERALRSIASEGRAIKAGKMWHSEAWEWSVAE